jgi:hypothetical protein
MPAALGPIAAPGLLLCEGPDDFAFFLSLFAALGIQRDIVTLERLDGRPQLHDRLNGLPIRDSQNILRALAIVCDADSPDDGPASFVRVRDDLRTTGFTPPNRSGEFVRGTWGGDSEVRVGVYVMPDNQVTGALEDLCLRAIEGDVSLPCVDDFLTCVSSTGGVSWRPQDASKARLNSWLASRSDPTLLLGYAMNRNLIDREHRAFDPIKAFLTQLAAAAAS